MEVNMKANGQMINSMALAKRFGIMDLRSMKVTLLEERSMAKEDLSGMMGLIMKVILKMEFFMELVFISSKNLIRLTMDNLLEERLKVMVR
jgi:hypothetical protein